MKKSKKVLSTLILLAFLISSFFTMNLFAVSSEDLLSNFTDEPSSVAIPENEVTGLDLTQNLPIEGIEDVFDKIQSTPSTIGNYKEAATTLRTEGKSGFNVFCNGLMIDFNKYENVLPIMENNRTLIPIRALSESLGATVDYNKTSKLITIVLNNKTIKLTVDSKNASVNGVSSTLDVAAKVVNGRTIIPLRFVSENFNKQVHFESLIATSTQNAVYIVSVY